MLDRAKPTTGFWPRCLFLFMNLTGHVSGYCGSRFCIGSRLCRDYILFQVVPVLYYCLWGAVLVYVFLFVFLSWALDSLVSHIIRPLPTFSIPLSTLYNTIIGSHSLLSSIVGRFSCFNLSLYVESFSPGSSFVAGL